MSRGLEQLAGALGCSERTLRRYANDGMLHGGRGGRGAVWLPPGEELYLKRHWSILRRLKRVLRTEPSVRLAVLFGSAATGDDRPDSDIDLLIDHATGDLVDVVRLQRRLRDRTGKAVNVVLLADAERSPSLLGDILLEGRVIVDRDASWWPLRRRRSRILRSAAAEEETAHQEALSGIAAARARLAD
jgi:predicted nucleotidyltransferase